MCGVVRIYSLGTYSETELIQSLQCSDNHVSMVAPAQCGPQELVMNLHDVLHDVKTAAVLIVQQLLYIHQRKHVLNVWNPFNLLAPCNS